MKPAGGANGLGLVTGRNPAGGVRGFGLEGKKPTGGARGSSLGGGLIAGVDGWGSSEGVSLSPILSLLSS